MVGQVAVIAVLVENNQDLQRLLSWADEVARLKVRANAETVKDLETAMKFGAQGVGLARTEHMFFGQDRILEMRRLILADNEEEIKIALKLLLHFQEEDFPSNRELAGKQPYVRSSGMPSWNYPARNLQNASRGYF